LNINMMEVANKRVITVDREEDIENIAAILGNKQTKKVPVEKKGVLAGIISRGASSAMPFSSCYNTDY
jgi:predicted transcriptional regulator